MKIAKNKIFRARKKSKSQQKQKTHVTPKKQKQQKNETAKSPHVNEMDLEISQVNKKTAQKLFSENSLNIIA